MNASFKRKKLFSTIITIVNQFLAGAEYAIIFPSAWAYLQSLGVTEEYWLGYTISAYSLSSGIASVLGGRLADIYVHQTKSVVLISIAIMAIGNIQYALGIGLWNILCARLLCGVGTAARAAMVAELWRVTEVSERTPILAVINAAQQIGLFTGPVFQILFSYCHFSVLGMFEIHPLNAAGAFMGIVWGVFLFAALAMYYNLTAELAKMQNSVAKTAEIRNEHGGSVDEGTAENSLKKATLSDYVNEFLTDTFVLLQSMVFSLYFGLFSIETTIPMMMQEYFGCSVFDVSLIFMVSGMAALMIFCAVAFFSGYIRDSTLQLAGYLLFTAAHVLLIVIVPLSEQGQPIHVGYFACGCLLLFFGFHIATIGNNGLTAKVPSGKSQGLGQGVRSLLCSFGFVFGPLWGGSTMKQPYWLLGLPMVILIINGLMLTSSFSELRLLEDQMAKASSEKVIDKGRGEEEPLLNESRQQ